uniref:Regulatory protein IE2 n=1 Tax=Mastomys natalensis cytomegalovirus 1 TaxID=2973541 RepID=A0A9Y1N7I0_9BETA|nr:regulatory protein IE2 [Mastomys natalensis cytomegalovirus 1]
MDVTMLNSRMIRTGDYHVIHARDPAPPKVIPSSKVPKTVIDDINIHINSPVRCDMSLGDILTDCDITYVPTRTETAAMDSLSDEVGTSGSDRTVKDLAGGSGDVDILTAAASISGISPESGDGRSSYKKSTDSPKHKDHRRQRLEIVVNSLHNRPRHSEDESEHPDEKEDKSSDSSSSSSSSEDESPTVRSKQFYVSSGSEEENDHRDSDQNTETGYDTSAYAHNYGDGRETTHKDSIYRKNVYGGSHSSRSSFRSSLGSLSPKYSGKRKSELGNSPVRKRYSPQYSDTDSDTSVQKPTTPAKPKRGPTKRGHRKIKDMMHRGSGGFVAPNAHRRGKVRDDDEKGKAPPTARALEYKNLPFRTQPIQHIIGTAMKYCRESTIHDKFILMYYTRSQDVRRAVDVARSHLGVMVNLSLSCPFLIEHTMPKNHSRETVQKVSEACATGTQAVWALNEEHTHDCLPRTSDYRTVMLQAATACDFMAALKVCLQLAQQFPRQVCVRLCSVEGGINPLPIYDAVVSNYANHQFEANRGYRKGQTNTTFPANPMDSYE